MNHPAIRQLIQRGIIAKPPQGNVSWPDGASLTAAKELGEIHAGPVDRER